KAWLPDSRGDTAEKLDVAFASAATQHADAIVDLGDPLALVEAPRVIALAARGSSGGKTLLPTLRPGWRSVVLRARFGRAGGYLRRAAARPRSMTEVVRR